MAQKAPAGTVWPSAGAGAPLLAQSTSSAGGAGGCRIKRQLIGSGGVLVPRVGNIGTPHGAHDLSARHQRRAFERQRRPAKSAFGEDAADIPMGAPAAGAVIGFVVAIEDVIAPLRRRGDEAATARLEHIRRRRHILGSFQAELAAINAAD